MTFVRPEKLPPVVILSGVRWGFLWQRHHALAECFAGAGYPTVFVETTGLANPSPNLYVAARTAERLAGCLRSSPFRGVVSENENGVGVFSPLALPPTSRVFRRLNGRVMVPVMVRGILAGLPSGGRPVVVAYPPTETTLQTIAALRPLSVHYDLSDDYAAFPGVPHDIRQTETRLLLRAETVSCTSETLYDRIRNLRPDADVIGPGVDYELFSSVRPEPTESSVKSGQTTVCYFGDITEERIDTRVLTTLAGAGHRVLLLGELRGRARGILGVPGIEHRGKIPHRMLPHHLRDADVLVLPYRENILTRSIAPAKLYECLATGLPTVSTPLPSVAGAMEPPVISFARGEKEFLSVIAGIRDAGNDADIIEARRDLAKRNSWDRIFGQIEEVIWRNLARNTKLPA